MSACPECLGPHAGPGHPSSVIVFSHAQSCGLGRAMDAVIAADVERTAGVPVKVTREPRDVERTLLAHVGAATPTSVEVERITSGGGVVARTYS